MGGTRDEAAALARNEPVDGDVGAWVRRFTEWTMIDGDLTCRYVWLNLPDPTGGTVRYTVPGTEIVRRLGAGDRFETVGEFRNGDGVDAMIARWRGAGGPAAGHDGAELRGIVGWAPEPLSVPIPREEIRRAFGDFAARLASASAGGEWAPLAAVFTDEVRVRDHVVGFVEGRHALSAYIRDGVRRSPFSRYRVRLRIIDGNRVSTVLRAEGPFGGLDVNVVLHYAGGRRWSYVEVVYNPQEIVRTGA
ncbi:MULTISPECIES: nuclear transport factor 2 family protein [unclassified Embleya]|uniref:nuclear transport factor 2 family protein n=1 Tax=unclassified Embleya TaxID=2699296 RepID=UPI0033DA84A4